MASELDSRAHAFVDAASIRLAVAYEKTTASTSIFAATVQCGVYDRNDGAAVTKPTMSQTQNEQEQTVIETIICCDRQLTAGQTC